MECTAIKMFLLHSLLWLILFISFNASLQQNNTDNDNNNETNPVGDNDMTLKVLPIVISGIGLLVTVLLCWISVNMHNTNRYNERLQDWSDKLILLLRQIEGFSQHWLDVCSFHAQLYWKVFKVNEDDETLSKEIFDHFAFIRMQQLYLMAYPSLDKGIQVLKDWFKENVSENVILLDEEAGGVTESLYVPPLLLQPMIEGANNFINEIDSMVEQGRIILLRCMGGDDDDGQIATILEHSVIGDLEHVKHLLSSTVKQQTFSSYPAWHRNVTVVNHLDQRVLKQFKTDAAIVRGIRHRLLHLLMEFNKHNFRANVCFNSFWCVCWCKRWLRQRRIPCCWCIDAGVLNQGKHTKRIQFQLKSGGEISPVGKEVPLKSLSLHHIFDAFNFVIDRTPDDFMRPTKKQFFKTTSQLRTAYLIWYQKQQPGWVQENFETLDNKYRDNSPWRISLQLLQGTHQRKCCSSNNPDVFYLTFHR